MKKEEKKKKGVLRKAAVTLAIVGVGVAGGILGYKKIPGFKNFVDGIFTKTRVPEIKTKSFRKYETINKKR